MKKLTLIISVLLLQISCNNDDTKKISYPECLSSKIQEILQSPVQNPKSTIEKYNYQNQTVYLIVFNGADSQSQVYNEKCELVCSIGGIGGSAQDTCINWENATYIETVWSDPR
jgi:hypothetical protein